MEHLPWNQYNWVTTDPCCRLDEFDRQQMCQVGKKQDDPCGLLIVGSAFSSWLCDDDDDDKDDDDGDVGLWPLLSNIG